VFVDLSNVAIGAQVGADGKRNTSIRINVPELVRCVHQNRVVKGRYLITSVAGTLEKLHGKKPSFIQDWASEGYEIRVQERRGGSEQMLDEALMVPMLDTIRRFGSTKLGTGPERKQHTLVLLSGDGNRNSGHHSFAEVIQDALSEGMFVEVWSWRGSASRVYAQEFKQHYGGSFSIHYFDDHKERIIRTCQANVVPPKGVAVAATAVSSAACDAEDDDDWMVCPITCEVITDAVATKFAPNRFYERHSLELWVQGHGTCPLTRHKCQLQDIISCASEMRARLLQHSAAAPAALRGVKQAGHAAAAAGSEIERPKGASYSITLQTTDKSIFSALPALEVRQSLKSQLPSNLAKALMSTSVTFGKSATDFLYLNFASLDAAAVRCVAVLRRLFDGVSLMPAQEAVSHINSASPGTVNINGISHKVQCAFLLFLCRRQ
jgi:hypothetical protein